LKQCPFCKKPVPDDATVCPHSGCGKPLPADTGAGTASPPSVRPPPPPRTVKKPGAGAPPEPKSRTVRPIPPGPPGPVTTTAKTRTPKPVPPSPAGPAQTPQPGPPDAPPPERKAKAKRPPPPGPVIMTKDSEQQRYLAMLEGRARAGRRRGRWLAAAVAAALLVSLIAGIRHYASSVLSYAKLDPAIRIERDGNDPDRLTLLYRPLSRGTVGFRRRDAGRETELLDRVHPDPENPEQKFQWRFSGVKTGDELKVTFRDGWSLATAVLSVPEAPPVPPLGDAVLTGEVVNATNNRPVAGVDVKIVGTRLKTRTGEDGRFRLEEAPSGPVAVEVSAPNFSTDQLERELVSGKETPVRVALSPGMKAGQIRLVLTWNDAPEDLDAHLEGPLPEGKRFHVYFHEKGDLKSREFVNLDVDDRDGNGPETITVLGVLPGTYHYFVHDYTHRDTQGNGALSRSGAEVKLYQRGQTYRFRANNESIGTVWRVCNIEVTEAGARIKKIDQYESKQLKTTASMADVVFLLDTGPRMADSLDKMKTDCVNLTDQLTAGGLDCHFGLVPFCDPAAGKPMNVVPMTGDLAAFRDRVTAAPDPNGEKLPESCLGALERGLKMEFRENVPVQFVLVADTPCRDRGKIAEIGERMKERNIKTVVIADIAEKDVYAPLYREGGRFRSFGGEEVAQPDAEAGSDTEALLAKWTFDAKKGNIADGLAGLGLYGRRTQADRDKWITQVGGTFESEQGVDEGMAWLARHQAEDGSWSNQCLGPKGANGLSQCEQEHVCTGPGRPTEMAHTGLALLAFQAGGHYYFNERKYSKNVTDGLEWLVSHQRDNGALIGSLNRGRGLNNWYMYEHGMATFALAEACAVAVAAEREPDERYLAAAKKAVRFIEENQHNDGGWRYTPQKSAPSDSSVSGWQVLALKTAREAGIEIDRKCVSQAERFFESCETRENGRTGYQFGRVNTEATTGVGMLVHQFLLNRPDSPLVQQAAPYLAQYAERTWGGAYTGRQSQPDYYLWYNCTLAMFQAGGEPWERWNKIVRDTILGLQEHEGCARGSWGPASRWGGTGGRIYTTALAVLTLQVYYRFAPREEDAPNAETTKLIEH